MRKFYLVVSVLLATAFALPLITFAAGTVLPVFGGGTGWGNIQSNTLLTGNGGSALSTTSIGSGLNLSGGVLTAAGGSGGVGTIATSSADTAGQLLYYTTNNGYPAKASGVATSSALCSGFITCSGFTVVGSVSPTITTTGQLGVGSGGTGAASFGQGWLYSTGGTNALAASSSPTVNYITATSSTATSTFMADVWLKATNDSPNPYLLVGTSSPGYGRIAGDTIDTYWDGNGLDLVNTFNPSPGTCRGSGFVANGNILAANSDYAALFFTNGGWTGSGCAFGNGTERPESLVLAEPTGDMDYELASSSNAVAFNWYTKNTTKSMSLANTGLLTVTNASTTNLTAGSSFFVNSNNVTGYRYPIFQFSATTTAWTGTSTVDLTAGFTGTMVDMQCNTATSSTDTTGAYTLRILVKDNATLMAPEINASTTVGNTLFTSNNTFTRGDTLELDAGNPTNSPIQVECSGRATGA